MLSTFCSVFQPWVLAAVNFPWSMSRVHAHVATCNATSQEDAATIAAGGRAPSTTLTPAPHWVNGVHTLRHAVSHGTESTGTRRKFCAHLRRALSTHNWHPRPAAACCCRCVCVRGALYTRHRLQGALLLTWIQYKGREAPSQSLVRSGCVFPVTASASFASIGAGLSPMLLSTPYKPVTCHEPKQLFEASDTYGPPQSPQAPPALTVCMLERYAGGRLQQAAGDDCN